MQGDQTYATLLRPIGQILERLRIESFAVVPDRNGFVVRDKTRNRAQLTPRERAFLAELHRSHADSLDKKDALKLAAGVFEWHVTERDVERFERDGRKKRHGVEQAPDSHSVSQILRVIGTILDQQHGKLCYISKDEQVVTLEYELPGGRKTTEQYNVPALYDSWVRMYQKRSARSAVARRTA
jgi:hypothetical protein